MFIYGAGAQTKVTIEILELNGIEITGLFDDNTTITELLDYKVSPFDLELLRDNQIIISIGENRTRKNIANNLPAKYGRAIHPKSSISKKSIIGEGTIIMGNAVINSGVSIGKHVIINTSASIDHDCVIEDFVHISPNATLTGNVIIGEGSWIGAGAVVINGINIGKWCTIGAGAVIIKDVPDGATVVGNPGKIIKIAESQDLV